MTAERGRQNEPSKALLRRLYQGRNPREIPLYTIPEAAYFLRLSPSTIRAWCGAGRLVEPARMQPPVLSFHNLFELHVLRAMRLKHRIPLQQVRKDLTCLQRKTGFTRPLLQARFQTNGRQLFIEHFNSLVNISENGQCEMKPIIKLMLQRIEFDEHGFMRQIGLWVESPDEPITIVANPFVSFGKPCIVGTAVPVSSIVSFLKAGDSPKTIANAYDLKLQQVEDALAWERRAAA